MGRISEQRIQLRRGSPGVAWGFRLQGGSDPNTPLSVQRVFSGSPSDGQLQRGDVVVSVDGRSLRGMSPLDAQDLITSTGLVLNLVIQRGGDGGDSSYGSQQPAQSNCIPQNTDTYSSGGSLPRSYGAPSQGGFSPPQAPQQPWASSYQAPSNFGTPSNSGYASYQPPSQFGSGGPSKAPSNAPNHYSPGGGPYHAQTNGGYNDYHSGGGQTFKSSATVFGGQGHASEGQHGGSGSGQRPGYGTGSGQRPGEEGYYGSEGPAVISQPRNEDGDDDYERKPVGSIKEMFNKPDETGPHAVGRIKGGRPRAPMYKPHEDTSFIQPEYGPSGTPSAKSSLTPSRPGAVQRGAPDNRPSSYVPPPVINPNAGGYGKKLYGYSQDSAPAPSRYVGGFVGINELTKAVPQPVPVKKPPGQKKKDFDPAQSSVLRVVQEEEERRKVGGPAPQSNEYDDQPPQHHPQQQRRGPPGQQQQRHPQQRKTGQQWEQQQQQQQQRPSVLNKTGGPSLQALLERDQALNPQEDPSNNRVQVAPQPQPSHGEYRRPGTSYKPAEHKVKAANVDDYPIPEHLLSGGRGGDKYQGAGYQSSYQPGGGYQSNQSGASYQSNQPGAGYQSQYPQDGGYGGQSYQSSTKFSPGSGSSGPGGFSPRSGMGGGSGAHGYQYGGSSDYGRAASGPGGGFYPSTSFGADGIPASDF